MMKHAYWSLALLIMCSTAVFAQTGSVQGVVNLTDGSAAAGARVMLDAVDGGQHGHHMMHGMTMTDANGAFTFTQVRVGSYTVIAMKMMSGFARATIDVVADQTTNVTLTLSGENGGGHHHGDSLTVVDLQGTAIVVAGDSMMHQMTNYFLDTNGDGIADYRLSFGPPWYNPGNGASRPVNGDAITIQGGLFTYGDPPMVIVYEINGQFWRQPGMGHGGHGGGDHGMMGCNPDSLTGVELAGTAQTMTMDSMMGGGMGRMHGEMTMIGLNTTGGMMPNYMLDFGRSDYNPGNGAQRPANGDNITIVGGQVYCPDAMMPCVIVYEINGQFWRQPGDTTGMGAPENPTSVDEPKPIGTPLSYLTATNYPNPFNPTTTIRYSVPVSGSVKLAVFDIVGREVAVLVNSSQTAGTHSVAWDGSKSASGIYFYRVTAGSQVFTNRMLLLK
jgi:hypothetical protein